MKRYTGSMDEPGRSVVARRPADRHGRRQNKERRPPRIHRIRGGRQMQYREIYQVLEDRRRADSRFVYDDYSRCRPKSQRHGRIQGPLWIVAKGPSGGRRLWIIQSHGGIELSVVRRDQMGLDHETVLCRQHRSQQEIAELLKHIFAKGVDGL